MPIDEGVPDEATLAALAERFYERYELIYGRGSSFRGARLEAVTFRCRATAPMPKPVLLATEPQAAQPPADARRRARRVYWSDVRDWRDTPVWDGDRFAPGHTVDGPAIVETTDTTVVVHAGQRLAVDRYGNFELSFGAA